MKTPKRDVQHKQLHYTSVWTYKWTHRVCYFKIHVLSQFARCIKPSNPSWLCSLNRDWVKCHTKDTKVLCWMLIEGLDLKSKARFLCSPQDFSCLYDFDNVKMTYMLSYYGKLLIWKRYRLNTPRRLALKWCGFKNKMFLQGLWCCDPLCGPCGPVVHHVRSVTQQMVMLLGEKQLFWNNSMMNTSKLQECQKNKKLLGQIYFNTEFTEPVWRWMWLYKN